MLEQNFGRIIFQQASKCLMTSTLQSKMSLAFYYDLMSQPSRALYIIFKISRLHFEDCPIALRNGEHLTDKFKRDINRFQKVPCIIDNGFKLAESIAILRYLSSKGKIPEYLYPKYFVEQARVDELLEWQHLTLRLSCSIYFRTLWLEPLLSGKKPSEKKIETLKNHMEMNLGIIENIWLDNSEFLCGKNMTAADIFAACEIEQTRLADYDVRIKHPKIRAWLKRVRAACNPYYDHAHQVVYKISGTAPNSKL